MSLPEMTPALLAEVMEATWPPAAHRALGPFTLRDGAGGGKRVSAASLSGAWTMADLAAAEAAMAEPLFMIREGDEALDAALAAKGYRIVDPVLGYSAPIEVLTGETPRISAVAHWPPLVVVADLWAAAGIGPARLQVMERVSGEKTAILGRTNDRTQGVAFVALHGGEAMVHALEVRAEARRQGTGARLLRGAANWAAAQGATRLSLVVTAQNTAARALYDRAGMRPVGQYHYRAR